MTMNLLDKLRVLGQALPPSHVTTPQEAMAVLSGLVHYVEHGEDIIAHALSSAMCATKNVPLLETLLSPDSEPRAFAVATPVTGYAASNATSADIAALATQVMEMQRLMAEQQRLMVMQMQGQSGTVAAPAAPVPAPPSAQPATSPPPTPPPSGGGDAGAPLPVPPAAAMTADAAALANSTPTTVTVEPADVPQHADVPPVVTPGVTLEPEQIPAPVIDPAPSDTSTRNQE